MTIGKKIAAGYGLALGGLVILGGLAFWSTTRLISNNERVEHTHKVLTELEGLLSMIKDAENGQRGFLLTAKKSYLKPYTDARTSLEAKVDHLRELTSDNPNQQLALRELKPLLDRR